MFSTEDTIVAIATPPGRGGIGVIRISGPQAARVTQTLTNLSRALKPRHATFTLARSHQPQNANDGAPLDQVIVTFFPGPASYTGEDVVEMSAHGSPIVLNGIVKAAVSAGARLAEPGEFTLRAFLNGRIDLPQAEAVADLIDAVTPLQARAAFDQLQGTLTKTIADIDADLFDVIARLEASVDFPDEGYHFIEPAAIARVLDGLIARMDAIIEQGRRGRLIREGHLVTIVGPPNVGKSSLFNALVGSARAIVTSVPGTTRDLVSETVDMEGLRITLVDTAGLRDTNDVVELEGVSRSREAIRVAEVVIDVCDGTVNESSVATLETKGTVVRVANKSDLSSFTPSREALPVSALTGAGVGELRRRLAATLGLSDSGDCPEITNVRHIELANQATLSLKAARDAVVSSGGTLSEEFVLADLQRARFSLEEISGHRSSEDVLTHIFTRFCIGK
jgi:tRNA modification GTPase